MIHYALRCAEGHGFDGWFGGSDAFERQAAAGLIACPCCGGTEVSRALMAPAIGRAAAPRSVVATAADGDALPAEVLAALQRLRARVEQTCDYVGDRFAEEALRMHRGLVDERAIYGEATEAEAERLQDEGIAVTAIPWVKQADS